MQAQDPNRGKTCTPVSFEPHTAPVRVRPTQLCSPFHPTPKLWQIVRGLVHLTILITNTRIQHSCARLYTFRPITLPSKKNQPPSAPKSKAKTVKEYHYPCVCLSCPFPLHRRERESASNGDFWGPTPKRKGRQPFPSPPTKASSTSHRLLPFSFPFHSFHSFHPCKGLAPEKKKSKKREKRERERTNKQTNIHNKTTQEERRRKIRRAVLNLIPSSP